MKITIGTRVRLSESGKREYKRHSPEHLAEFKDSVGTVIEHFGHGATRGQLWDVRWDEGLKYVYAESDLEVLE